MTEINSSKELDDAVRQKGVPSIKNYTFTDYIFNTEISIYEANNIEFRNCTFNEKISLTGSYKRSTNFHNCTFSKEASFSNATFENKVRMQSVTFKDNVDFDNTKFNDLCDFWNTKFYQTTIFYKTDFLQTAVFSRTIFYENVLFTYTLIDKVAIFRGAIFKKGLDFSTAIINGTLNLFDFNLRDFDSNRKKINEDEYEEMISEEGIIPERNKRETFRIIKKQFENQNNHILALDYSVLELKSHSNDLQTRAFSKNNLNQDLVILGLNLISNKNGKSWLRGVIFTFSVAIIFYYITIISTNNYIIGWNLSSNNISKAGKYFFEYMTPTHKVDFLDTEGTSILTYFFDFVGRIFIAFGIYQTVQAFRKYGK
jgi:hypothetical protein